MTTIEERREVARRLRELADYCDENEMSLSDDDWPGILSDYIWPEDGGYHIYDEDCRRLADLIEPGEPKVKCVAEVKVDGDQLEKLVHEAVVEYAGVDREALLALADEMEEFGNLPIKNPGIRVLQNDDFSRELGYARRIREALGVKE